MTKEITVKKPTDLGTNRTGVLASPIDSKKTAEAALATPLVDDGGPLELALERSSWANGADPVGSMPPPTSIKGAVKTTIDMVKGHHATVFLDKLGERLAFERTGVRLYEALLIKLDAADLHEGGPTRAEVERIRNDELRHFDELREAMESLGGDPTAMTPCADVAAVAAGGVVKVLTDPRTTLSQCLDALLMVELVDNDAWVLLADLADGFGQNEMGDRFRVALADEEEHLTLVRRWVNRGVAGQAGLAATPGRPDQEHPASP
jgi:rubrerythrin